MVYIAHYTTILMLHYNFDVEKVNVITKSAMYNK